MFGQKNWLVIFVTPAALHLLAEGDSSAQLLPLPNTIVSNLELLNKDALYTLITDWVKQKPYKDTEIVWILSEKLCFDFNISTVEPSKVDSEILQYLDTVPFEDVLSHTYVTPEGKVVFATNKDLIMALVQGFSLHGYTSSAVLPSILVPMTELSLESGKLAIKRASELKKESMIAPTTSKPILPVPKNGDHPKSSLPLLLSVFGVLLAILGFVIYLNQ